MVSVLLNLFVVKNHKVFKCQSGKETKDQCFEITINY